MTIVSRIRVPEFDAFASPEQLMTDFLADVTAWQKAKGAGE
ncbi:MAG: hypothetical protein ABI668_00270 [Sphingorhabdus sp.]